MIGEKEKAAIGQVVRDRRIHKGWSKEYVAAEAGLSMSSMMAAEAGGQGDSVIKLTTLSAVCDVLGIKLSTVLKKAGL